MKTKLKLFFPNWLFYPAALALPYLGETATAQIFTTIRNFGILTNVTGAFPQSALIQGPDGMLYGTARSGEGIVRGAVFKVQPDGSQFRVLKWFTYINSLEGVNPFAALALSGTVLYGTTASGGSSNRGTIFKVNTDGTGYTVLKNFAGSDGSNPYYAGLTLSASVIYGATYSGGVSNSGTLFRLNTDGTGYSVLKSFTGGDGANPNADLTLSGGVLYGTTENGGSSRVGTVFQVNPDGSGYTVLKSFSAMVGNTNSDGAYPDGALTLSGSVLYGTTYRGGTLGYGTLFQMNTDGTGHKVLKNFAGSDGANPAGRLPLSGNVLYGSTVSGGSSNYGTVFHVNTDGTGYTMLKAFSNSDGAAPYGGMTVSGSVLFGTTSFGGNTGWGTVFKLNADGTGSAVLKEFTWSEVTGNPQASLTASGGMLYGTGGVVFKLNTDGTGYAVLTNFPASDWSDLVLSGDVLYGMTVFGGSSGGGILLRVNTDGTGLTVLKNFDSNNGDGAYPHGGLALSGSVLYGTTQSGGSSGGGTVFKVNTDGTGYTVLKNFDPSAGDGASPSAGLRLSGGVLYGTTGGGDGTVFKVNTDGTGYAVLKTFAGTDGSDPLATLTLSGGVLYGTTRLGGSSGNGTVFKLNTEGTGFLVLKDFSGSDGGDSRASVTLVGTTLYGTTRSGGSLQSGTVFKINTDGTGYAVLKTFTNSPDGASPVGGLTLVGNALYGTTAFGGTLGEGTVFSLTFAPELSITPSSVPPSGIILSWPANVGGFDYTGYTLQSTTNLISPAVWITNFPAPVVVNGQNTVTNATTGARKFFRLMQ